MVERTRGNLLDADVEALVNTVNSVGIMGKGIALQFKKAFPQNYEAYRKECHTGGIVPGRMFIFKVGALHRPRYIINFPTKRHWKGKSKIEDIAAGLAALTEDVKRLDIESIALPPLGCGNGGLEWDEVSQLIEQAFADLPCVRVLMYEPAGAPEASKVRNRTARPKMTVCRSVILSLINRYLAPGYDEVPTLLEVHKLAYFMQEGGESLRLQFEEGPYGPYADTLRHVLNDLEGHYIRGIGDGRNEPGTPIELLPGAAEQAEDYLNDHSSTQECFTRVAELIDGFETPSGMELLSSVHWVATRKDPQAKTSVTAAIAGVQGWSERKARLFRPEHITAAWQRLRKLEWL